MRNYSYENEFDLHENERAGKTHFHMNGFALRLVLRLRQKRRGNGLFVSGCDQHPGLRGLVTRL